jgi:SAM-dependent methyltransferase
MIASQTEQLVSTVQMGAVDKINAIFYGRFQYPWIASSFDCLADPDFERVMLNQTLGSWDFSALPSEPKIWVAGCGTNQAIFTALRFPGAHVLGSDLSMESLETCTSHAAQLGISNLTLKQESINEVAYSEEFDYVICTGVIHHNAHIQACLNQLRNALKPTGLLELMVYNHYHRVQAIACQEALKALVKDETDEDYKAHLDARMQIVKALIQGTQMESVVMQHFLASFKGAPEAALADTLLQPVEHPFTISSLEALTADCGLEFIAPCINQYDKSCDTFSWNMDFGNSKLQNYYDALPDLRRWQVSNHLKLDKSPMLWFYFQRHEAGRGRKTERQLCREFLNLSFAGTHTLKKIYLRDAEGNYRLAEEAVSYPSLPHPDPVCQQVLNALPAQNSESMRSVLERLGMKPTFQGVNKLRLSLTTNAFPYLKCAPVIDAGSIDAGQQTV